MADEPWKEYQKQPDADEAGPWQDYQTPSEEPLREASIGPSDLSALQRFRYGPIGQRLFGPPPAEQEAMGGPGARIGALQTLIQAPSYLLSHSSVPPQVAEPIRNITEPVINLLPSKTAQGIATGVREVGLNLPLAPFAAPAKWGRALLAYFTEEQLRHLPERAKSFLDAAKRGDTKEAASLATQEVLTDLALGLGLRHEARTMFPKPMETTMVPPPVQAPQRIEAAQEMLQEPLPSITPEGVEIQPQPLTPEVPNAGSQSQATEIHGLMRELPREGEQAVPAEVSGEGVQLRAPGSETGALRAEEARPTEVPLNAEQLRKDIRSEGVSEENTEALLNGSKSVQQVVEEQLGVFKPKTGGLDAKTIIVEERPDGGRDIGFGPEAGPAATSPRNAGTMSHSDAVALARDSAIERLQQLLLTHGVDVWPDRPTAIVPKPGEVRLTADDIGWNRETPESEAFRAITPDEATSPEALKGILTADAQIDRSGTEAPPESTTRRVTALLDNETGKVELVSTYRTGRGAVRILDPRRHDVGAVRPHVALDTLLEAKTAGKPRFKPLYSILLDEPVQKFRQSFPNEEEFRAQFAEPAETQRLANQKYREGAAVPVEGEAPIAGALTSEEPITDAEAGALHQHITDEVGKITQRSDIDDAFLALKERRENGKLTPKDFQILNAWRKLVERTETEKPHLRGSDEAINETNNRIFEDASQAADRKAFVERTLAMGQRPVPGGQTPGAASTAPKASAVVPPTPAPANRPLGVVATSPGLGATVQGILAAPGEIKTAIEGIAGKSMPRITKANRAVGEAGVRYASSKIAAKPNALIFTAKTLEGTGVDQAKFGAALTEDNLRSVRQGFLNEADRVTDPESADALRAKADAVTTLIGAERSPFRTEAEYQAFLNEPATQRAIANHIQQWNEVIDPMFKRAQGIDPDVELPSRGLQTGARVNLKAVLEDEPASKPVRGQGAGNLTASFKKKSPFARAAKGTGAQYDIDYASIIANTFDRQLEIANQNEFHRQLIESGLAKTGRPGLGLEMTIEGKPVSSFPLSRRVIISDGRVIPAGENIYIRQDLAKEYRNALNADSPHRIPVLTPLANTLNKTALAGFTDMTVHISNLITALSTRPGSKLLLDTALKSLGRADLVPMLGRLLKKATTDNRQQIAELSTIGAMKAQAEYGPLSTLARKPWQLGGRSIQAIDRGVRLVMDDVYQGLVRESIADPSETNRREFINQVGQYNKRLQGQFTRWLRDTGFGPFVTAGKTFNTLGVRTMTLSPGLKAATPQAAAMLRANAIAGWMGFAVLVGTLNYLSTKDKGGGVSGRPGTPIGNIDFGTDDADGNPQSFPLGQILGYSRAMRVTGVRGLVESQRRGLSTADTIDAQAHDLINSWSAPALGPTPRTATVATTGYQPAVGIPRLAPVAAPGKSQIAQNIQTALEEANPLVASLLDIKRGKTLPEALRRQFPRFTMVPGKTAAQIENYPERVNRARLIEFKEDLIRRARRLPPDKRADFIMENAAELPWTERDIAEIKRRVRY